MCKLTNVKPDCGVYDLAARWVDELKLGVHPSRVVLHLVKWGPGAPSASEEAAAKLREPLEPRQTLRDARLEDGTSLLAEFDAVQPSGVGGSCFVYFCAPLRTLLCCRRT